MSESLKTKKLPLIADNIQTLEDVKMIFKLLDMQLTITENTSAKMLDIVNVLIDRKILRDEEVNL